MRLASRPAPRLIALLAWLAALGLAVPAGWLPAWVWAMAAAALAMAALVDGVRVRRLPSPEIVRVLPDALPIGVERDVGLQLACARALRVDVHDLHPSDWQVQGLPRQLDLGANSVTRFDYRARPSLRGDAHLPGVQLRVHAPWRLWRQLRTLGAPRTVRIYPNFAPLARFALFSAEQASRLVGAHVKRRRGEGTDFHQMRDYRVGDSLRRIDWKATARARRLISREYQDERNQQLLLVVDTGRRMLAREGDVAHFDRVLDASLVVSYLALRQGDGVGLYAASEPARWVPAQRSLGAIDTLLRACYDLQPQALATDYLAIATELSLRQRRRALVMLITNVRDEDIDELLPAVRLLQKRHLVCVASLRESELDTALDADVRDLQGAVRAGAVAHYLEQRSAAHDVLRHHGVMVLDVTCQDLPGALVERYLAVKRDGLL